MNKRRIVDTSHYQMDYSKRRYGKRIDENQCVRCGIDLGDSPFLRCEPCREIINERARKSKEKRKALKKAYKSLEQNAGILIEEDGRTIIDEMNFVCHGCAEKIEGKAQHKILVEVSNRNYLVKKNLCNMCYENCDDFKCNDCHFEGKRGFIYDCKRCK
jgi:hypothetical protein